MKASEDIKVTKVTTSKLAAFKLEDAKFGKTFTDHMFIADFEGGVWVNPRILPYQNLSLSPATAALHYGQSIFEGMKAYGNLKNSDVAFFRPQENFKRFNISALRMKMPEVPESIFMEGVRQLVTLDKDWVLHERDHSLYIRPLLFSSDPFIGVRPSLNFKFIIILSPTGPYYADPMRIYVEEKYVRAVPGGVGNAKTAGNYAAAMLATAIAEDRGYDQVLWTDAFEHRYVQECGTMNAFFIIGNKAITPGLETGTILAGITRDTVIQLLRDKGLTVEERRLPIEEIENAYKAGNLKEVFGTGTAATIAYIKELRYKDFVMNFEVDKAKIALSINAQLMDIRQGTAEDKYGWMVPL